MCGMKRHMQKLCQHILRYVSKFRHYECDNLSLAKNLCENILLRPVLAQLDTEGLFIESWSASAGYSAEMLTEDGNSWRVEDESTLASSVNIEAEYPARADHEELA